MDYGPLVAEEIDAGAELVRQFDQYEPVAAAFWLKASDEEYRYLYIASEQPDGITAAYREVFRLASRSPVLDPFRVKLIGVANPLAQAALEIHARFPALLPTRLGGMSFGGQSADDVYVYPPLPVAAH